ncbi:homoserine O-succinyltransferase MetX [Arenimonas metalli]|uniref:homoserine O-succinyltransferase MetX n=1 Tax=Arenimonas metalli TaxID=948077 RepID=UPI0026C6AE29
MSFHLAPAHPDVHDLVGGTSVPMLSGEGRSGLKSLPQGPGGFTLPLELALRHAGPRRVVVRGELLGLADAPLVIVAGGISAGRHAAAGRDDATPGWWDAQVGPGRAIDTRRLRVLAIDWLGADGALDVPIDSADQADALAAVLDALGVGRALAFIGASYGAMVGLQFAARHGDRIERLVAISGAHRAHPYASAWRALQRQCVALGRSEGAVSRGLALARQFAMLSYRTPEEFGERFDAPPALHDGVARCAAEDYLAHCGQRYAARWTSTAFLRLSESIDLHRVDPAAVRVPTTVVAIEEDRLVPLADLQQLVETLGGPATLRPLRSRYGHDAFLKEDAAIARLLTEALAAAEGGAK